MLVKLINKASIAITNLVKYIKSGGVTNVSLQQVSINKTLVGKKCVVTGGSSGIGLFIAKALLNAGASVVITGRDKLKLEKVQAEINNDKFYICQWDVADISVIHDKLDDIILQIGSIDIFINNAGYMDNTSCFDDESVFDNNIRINLKAVLYISNGIANYYVKQKIKGKIINISSFSASKVSLSPYNITKRGVNSITEGLALKYIDKGIIVNGVAPGYVPTGINKRNIENNAYLNTPNKRYIFPEEIAEIALFLASDRANGIVGQTIYCDGGLSIR